jgi:DNA invertase Pin-like site-specific DNA recombinase
MKAGYARVSTKEQTVDLQVDALKKAGCTAVYTEIMSGTRAERPILGKLLENLRTGDVLVVWKLDRLGRSLKHLIEVVNELMTRKIGLKSLNDPIDTTTPQGRLTFNLFASLAEFERDVNPRTDPSRLVGCARSRAQGRQAKRGARQLRIDGLRGRDTLSRRQAQQPRNRRQTSDLKKYFVFLLTPPRRAYWRLSGARQSATKP